MNLVKKITMRDIAATEQLERVKSEKISLDIAHVGGTARGVKSGTSSFGEWTALTGDFWAQNVATGEEYRSTVLIMPSIAQDLVVNALRDSDNNAVDLAFTITATPDVADGVVRGRGYKFGAKPVIQPKEADEMSRIKSLFAGQQKPQLPAPQAVQPQPHPQPQPQPQQPKAEPAKHHKK